MLSVGKIFSTLGNPNSLIPLAIKDSASTTGMTVASYATGKEEGHDRLIDEVGTEALWLLGIPGYKWLFDKTVFKAYGFDSKFDVRNLKHKDVFEKIKEYAPTEEIQKNIEKIGKKQGTFKNVALAKFFFSTIATIASYIGLTRAKHKYTEKKITKNLIAEHEKRQKISEAKDKSSQNNQEVAFKGLGSVVKNFAFSPVRNMWLLDGAITTERLYDSRNPQEFTGYAIKEGSLLFFMYYAGDKIQKYLQNRANNKYNKSIGLDAVVLEEGKMQKAFENGTIEKSIAEFNKANTSDAAIYEFLYKNPENEIIKAAKQSEIIKMYKNTDKIDTRKYIDLDELRGVNKKVETLYKQYQDAIQKGETSEQFFKGVKKLKRHSILTAMGSCMFALGVVTPFAILAKRLLGKDDAEFKTKTDIRQKLIEDGVIEA